MKALQRPPFPRGAVLFGLGLFAVLCVLFQVTAWDRQAAAAYYAQGWPGNNWGWSSFLYLWGERWAVAGGVLGLIAFVLSFGNPQRRHWRGPGLYFALLLLLGPGLLVNGLAKALCGRPRPSETLDFGGLWPYLRPLQLGTPGQGQSFLSGHAAAAWYWFGLFWALPRPGLRWLSLLLTLLYGGLMAWARVSQGAHWVSDTVLCGAAIFSLAAALSPLLHWQPSRRFWSRPGLTRALVLGVLAWLSLSHVRYEDRRFIVREAGVPAPSQGWRAQERPVDWALPLDAPELGIDLESQSSDLRLVFDQDAVAPALPLRLDTVFQGQALLAGSQSLSVTAVADATGQGLPGLRVREDLRGLWLSAHGQMDLSLPRAQGVDARLHAPKSALTIGPLPEGRRVLLSRLPEDSTPPVGFHPYGSSAWLREGALPLIALDITARSVRFE